MNAPNPSDPEIQTISVPIGDIIKTREGLRRLIGSKHTGFSIGEPVSAAEWTTMVPGLEAKAGDRTAVLLVGSWEGEGGIAVYHREDLVLLLHFDASEEFASIRFEGGKIVAESGGYPEKFLWEFDDALSHGISVRLISDSL